MIGSSDISRTSPGSETVYAARPRAHDKNTRIPRPAILAAATGLALVMLLSGCGDRGDVGIFASIEREEKIEKSNLPEDSTAGSMVYDAGQDKYYVALGQLYSRGRGSNDWDDVSHPSGYRDGHTLDIVSVDGTIYVAFFDTQSTKSELFELNSFGSSVWKPGKEISKLIAVDIDGPGVDAINEELFAVTLDSDKEGYNLVYAPASIGEGSPTPNTVLSGVPRVIDGTFHPGAGITTYLFVTKGQLYRGDPTDAASGSFTAVDGPFSNYGGTTFVEDAFGSGQDWLLVTSTKGDIAYTTDPSATPITWTTEPNDDDRGYTDIAYVEFAPEFTGLVVGMDTRETSSGGYYEVDSALGTDRPDGDNYRAADISDASIHGFYVDSANETLFALTNGDGLWSATYDGGEPEWSWE
jgi:hypothetical protein